MPLDGVEVEYDGEMRGEVHERRRRKRVLRGRSVTVRSLDVEVIDRPGVCPLSTLILTEAHSHLLISPCFQCLSHCQFITSIQWTVDPTPTLRPFKLIAYESL